MFVLILIIMIVWITAPILRGSDGGDDDADKDDNGSDDDAHDDDDNDDDEDDDDDNDHDDGDAYIPSDAKINIYFHAAKQRSTSNTCTHFW